MRRAGHRKTDMAEHATRMESAAGEPLVARRTVFATVAVAYAASFIPRTWAGSPDPSYSAFVTVSEYLTGHPVLDGALAMRAYSALAGDDEGFKGQVQSLSTLIAAQKPDPMTLQAILDGKKSPLAALPRKIVKAWYLGVVGDGDKARCIAFENNLTNRAVADHLRPPSYCFGTYGSWVQKPL
jgi:hypothetical protein